MALYRATNGSQWLHQTGWLSNARLDNWFGIYVDSTAHSYLPYPLPAINNNISVCTTCNALNPPSSAFCEECGMELEITAEALSASSRVLSTGLVVGLDLENNRLSGPISAELGQMASLQYLDLPRNQLSGPIPPRLGQMTNLRYLDLSRNQLSGPIPAELSQMTSLWKRIVWKMSKEEKEWERREYFYGK